MLFVIYFVLVSSSPGLKPATSWGRVTRAEDPVYFLLPPKPVFFLENNWPKRWNISKILSWCCQQPPCQSSALRTYRLRASIVCTSERLTETSPCLELASSYFYVTCIVSLETTAQIKTTWALEHVFQQSNVESQGIVLIAGKCTFQTYYHKKIRYRSGVCFVSSMSNAFLSLKMCSD